MKMLKTTVVSSAILLLGTVFAQSSFVDGGSYETVAAGHNNGAPTVVWRDGASMTAKIGDDFVDYVRETNPISNQEEWRIVGDPWNRWVRFTYIGDGEYYWIVLDATGQIWTGAQGTSWATEGTLVPV